MDTYLTDTVQKQLNLGAQHRLGFKGTATERERAIELVWVSYVTCQVLGKKCCSTESHRAAFFDHLNVKISKVPSNVQPQYWPFG